MPRTSKKVAKIVAKQLPDKSIPKKLKPGLGAALEGRKPDKCKTKTRKSN